MNKPQLWVRAYLVEMTELSCVGCGHCDGSAYEYYMDALAFFDSLFKE